MQSPSTISWTQPSLSHESTCTVPCRRTRGALLDTHAVHTCILSVHASPSEHSPSRMTTRSHSAVTRIVCAWISVVAVQLSPTYRPGYKNRQRCIRFRRHRVSGCGVDASTVWIASVWCAWVVVVRLSPAGARPSLHGLSTAQAKSPLYTVLSRDRFASPSTAKYLTLGKGTGKTSHSLGPRSIQVLGCPY